MKSFPIYHEVESCVYKSKSYKREEKELNKFGSIIEFTIPISSSITKKVLFKNENGKAGRYIKTELNK